MSISLDPRMNHVKIRARMNNSGYRIFGFYIYECVLNDDHKCLLISKNDYGDFCSGVDIAKVYRINSNKIFLEI